MRNGIKLFVSVSVLLIAFSCTRRGERVSSGIPQFHFTAGINWTGEPTGLVYDKGVYHLFYQYNPSGSIFGNIHWGHAVSRDLFQWQIEPMALFPNELGYLESGSVIVDSKNTSGFGEAPFIAFYMYNNEELRQNVFLAYSQDEGRSWKEFGKILLPDSDQHHFRNPHVSWNKEIGKWLMTISSDTSILFYCSPDCKTWTFLSEFADAANKGNLCGGSAFFPMTVQGNENITKWVLLVNSENSFVEGFPATRYYVGDFDGHSFQVSQTKELWLDYGKDNAAGSVFNGMEDDSPVYMGWMNCWEYANLLPDSAWRGNMTLPRRLSLLKEGSHYLLSSTIPIELKAYQADSCQINAFRLSDKQNIQEKLPFRGEPFVIRLQFDNKDNKAIWKARNYGVRLITSSNEILSIGYQNELSYYYIDRRGLKEDDSADGFNELMGASYRSEVQTSDWCIVWDGNSIELFGSEGRSVISSLCYSHEVFDTFEIFAESGSVQLLEASIIRLDKRLNIRE